MQPTNQASYDQSTTVKKSDSSIPEMDSSSRFDCAEEIRSQTAKERETDPVPGLVKCEPIPQHHPPPIIHRSRTTGGGSVSQVRLGASIRIRAADAIHHKLRPYASTLARVISLPIHPNTWFGIQLYDGTRVKVRRSAFDCVDASDAQLRLTEGFDDASEVMPSLHSHGDHGDQSDESESHYTSKKVHGKARKICKTNLVGQFVVIESGRYSGRLGYVTRGGNGYFAVHLLQGSSSSGSPSVMKRSIDLRVVPAPAEYESTDFAQFSSMVSKRKQAYKSDDEYEDEEEEEDYHYAPPPLKKPRTEAPRDDEGVKDWVHKRVVQTKGKHRGELGTVTRSGHDFYAVHVPGRGTELMKRANELEPYDVQEFTIPIKNGKDLRDAACILMDMLSGSSHSDFQPLDRLPQDSREPSDSEGEDQGLYDDCADSYSSPMYIPNTTSLSSIDPNLR
eukprot:g80102.t1